RQRGWKRIQIDQLKVGGEVGSCQHQFTSRIERKAVAIENEIIVPTNLIDKQKRATMLEHMPLHQRVPPFDLAKLVRTCGKIDEDVNTLLRKELNRVRLLRRWAVIKRFRLPIPGVFADVNSQTASQKLQRFHLNSCLKIPLFIEHIVVGQQ